MLPNRISLNARELQCANHNFSELNNWLLHSSASSSELHSDRRLMNVLKIAKLIEKSFFDYNNHKLPFGRGFKAIFPSLLLFAGVTKARPSTSLFSGLSGCGRSKSFYFCRSSRIELICSTGCIRDDWLSSGCGFVLRIRPKLRRHRITSWTEST